VLVFQTHKDSFPKINHSTVVVFCVGNWVLNSPRNTTALSKCYASRNNCWTKLNFICVREKYEYFWL